MAESELKQAARDLWENTRLTGVPLDRRLVDARDAGYWRRLVPGLHIERVGPVSMESTGRLTPAAERDVVEAFRVDGYLQTAPIVPRAVVDAMCAAVAVLGESDWPAVFAWVFDEFWCLPRTPPVAQVLEAILGPGYRQSSEIRTHVVAGGRGATGWRPHVDHAADRRLTIWIPLSDATVDEGCMCVMPASVVGLDRAGWWYASGEVSMHETLTLLHQVRPLPAEAGSVLGWDTRVLHWGAPRRRAGAPRVSISMEFLPGGTGASALGETPGVGPGELPDFQTRLEVIAAAIRTYAPSEPRAQRYLELAGALRVQD